MRCFTCIHGVKFLSKVALTLGTIMLAIIIGFNTGADATTKDDALNSVVIFLNAQKNCDIDNMLKHSEHAKKSLI